MLSLKLLGQPELRQDGQRVRLTIKKTWGLLLLLACNGAMPRGRLAALLWPALDEAAARRNLRRELARLREADVPGLVHAADDWIALQPSVELDLKAFEAVLQAGDTAAALALWRGPLADGLIANEPQFDQWLATQRDRMHGLWRRALQARAEKVQQTDPEEALLHWQQLLADDPLQEQHHQAVMGLHVAAGRREAALAQYTSCRTLLRDELGLAPAAQTEALVAALREADAWRLAPAAAAAADGAADAPGAPGAPGASDAPAGPRLAAWLPDTLPFVGRDAEVAAMEAAWRAGHALVIEGEGGVGKTRLALDFAAAHGPFALARCRASDAGVPYAAWTRVLRALAGKALTRDTFGALPTWACDELSRLLPEIASGPAALAPIRSDEERSRFFEACAAAWQALTADSFDAVVLDDWHLADATSRALLAFVVQRAAGHSSAQGEASCRVLLLMRPQPDGLGGTQALTGFALGDAANALHLRLQSLEPAVVFDLVRQLSGARDPARFAARLQAATEGNPFFLLQTLRHLAETGALTADADGVWRTPFDDATQDYRELPMPLSVREAVLARVARLGDAPARVLEAAALAAEPFSPALLAPACALSELQAVLAIEAAVNSRLLREHESGGYAFTHDLVQQALDAALSPERRRLIHRRLALGAEAVAAPAAVVAAHHEASGDTRRAVAHRLAAAEQAQALHALPEAMDHWQRALDGGATPQQALRAHQGLTTAARLSCQFDRMQLHGDALQALAATGGMLSTAEQADALTSVANNLVFGNRADAALLVLDRLPAALLGTLSVAHQAQALNIRGCALRSLGRLDEARGALVGALKLPGLPAVARSDLLEGASAVEMSAGNPTALLEHADALIALARQMGDEETVARALFCRSLASLMTGDAERAAAGLEQAAASFGSRGSVLRQRGVLYNLSVAHQARSQHAQALAAVQRGWALVPALPEGELWMMYRLAFVDAHLASGHLGDAWVHAQAALAFAQAQNLAPLLLAATLPSLELLSLLGESALARQVLARVSPAAVHELHYTGSEHWIAVSQFELSQGDAAAARQALALSPAAAAIADVRVRARHALAAAELALALGDGKAALALLPEHGAEGMNDEMRTRALALAVRAQGLGGVLQEGTVQAATRTLALPSPFAPATGLLHRALAQALQMGVVGAPAGAQRAHDQFVGELARSLDGHPALQEAFLRLNA